MYKRIFSASFLALMAICLVSCKHQGNIKLFEGRTASDSITVKVITIGATETVGITSYVGTVESSRTSVVTSPTSGTLTALYVRKGQRVSKGQVIAKIESQTLQSSYKMAQATYDQAKDGMDRLQQVYGTGSVSDVKMVEMKTNLDKAEAAVEASRKALEDCNVKAPFSGVVDELPVTAGVELSIAEPIVTLVDVNATEIHFPLPENEFSKVAVGADARVVIPALNKTFSAKVSSKGSVASQLSHSYDCTLGRLSDAKGIMPGMVCKVFIDSDSGNGIVIPATSVMTDNDGRYVWTVKDGIVGKNFITVGGYSGDGIIVSEGLSDGLGVIVEGARKVSTGMSVKTEEKW